MSLTTEFAIAQQLFIEGDHTRAIEMLISMAERGHMKAYETLGWLYLSGNKVERDLYAARRFYSKAADGGDPTAQFNLAIMMINGDGGPREEERAFNLFRTASGAGQL